MLAHSSLLALVLQAAALVPAPVPPPTSGAELAAPIEVPSAAEPEVSHSPDPDDVSIVFKGERLTFEYRAAELSTLLYHLHCLSGAIRCSSDAFRHLWRTELSLSEEDLPRLEEWRRILGRYASAIDFVEGALTFVNAPPSWELRSKLLIAGFSSSRSDELRRKLAVLLTPADAAHLAEHLDHFAPRFHAWWLESGRAPARDFAMALADLMQSRELTALCEQVARFYGSALPKGSPVVLHVVLRPLTEQEQQGGPARPETTFFENHALLEAQAGERPEPRVGLLLRELFSYLYWSRTADQHLALQTPFAASPEPSALGLYALLEETLTAALGNGLVAEKVLDKTRFQALLSKQNGLHDEPLLDHTAKAVMRALERRLASDGMLDDGFANEFIKLSSEALGPRATRSPRLPLQARAVVYPDRSFEPHLRRLREALPAIHTRSHQTFERWALEQYPQLSGVLFTRWSDLSALEAHPGVVPAAALAEIREEAKACRGLAYGVRRSPHADVYVLAGDDEVSIRDALEAFLRYDQRFEG
ncbi:MAG: hypothetical protein HY901_09945, partial [Deltaproteobacteria bacterium]|nr:hypothetical protein [Deltaproteobacteria bacterium]